MSGSGENDDILISGFENVMKEVNNANQSINTSLVSVGEVVSSIQNYEEQVSTYVHQNQERQALIENNKKEIERLKILVGATSNEILKLYVKIQKYKNLQNTIISTQEMRARRIAEIPEVMRSMEGGMERA